MFTLVCCNFSKSQGGKIQTLLELSYYSHLKKEGMTAAIAGHKRRGGRSKPYLDIIVTTFALKMSECLVIWPSISWSFDIAMGGTINKLVASTTTAASFQRP